MDTVIALAPLVGCAVVMVFCLRMAFGGSTQADTSGEGASAAEVAELREELTRLRAELTLARSTDPAEPLAPTGEATR